jgi:hypothetical protein
VDGDVIGDVQLMGQVFDGEREGPTRRVKRSYRARGGVEGSKGDKDMDGVDGCRMTADGLDEVAKVREQPGSSGGGALRTNIFGRR